MDAGPFAADVASFELHLAAENKAAGTIRIYTGAPRWFAAAHLLRETGKTRWEQVDTQDVQRWVVWLLRHYSQTYAYQQYRSLQQFFRWLAAEDEIADPMARLRAPTVADKPVPFFTSVELSQPRQGVPGQHVRTAPRRGHPRGVPRDGHPPGRAGRDLLSPGRPEPERCGPAAPGDLHPGKRGKDRIVRIDHEAARRVDRYLRVRARHPQAYRSRLWLGAGDRGPLTRDGIYQMVKRRGDQAGVRVYPHRFRHHFSHTWLERGGAEGDLMELNGWSSPQMLERYGGSARGVRARRHYDLVMTD